MVSRNSVGGGEDRASGREFVAELCKFDVKACVNFPGLQKDIWISDGISSSFRLDSVDYGRFPGP